MAVLDDGKADSCRCWRLACRVPGSRRRANAAGQAGVPLLRASMSTVKGSLVGQSESQMKRLLQSISSICDDEVVMIATCNEFDALAGNHCPL